jgi:hypothetical protein
MAYFTELENNTIGFEGVSDRASELVRAMFGLAKLTGTEIQMKGNKSVDLLHSPSGGEELTDAGERLITAAYALTHAELAEATDSHALYSGYIPVSGGNEASRSMPLVFKEVYTTDDSSAATGMKWSVRTDYPPMEQRERKRLMDVPTGAEKDKLIELGTAVTDLISHLGETAEPEYRFDQAA